MRQAALPLDPEILVAHHDFMRAVARSLLADEHLAEDVVQQATVTALERPPLAAAAVRGWLARVVRNLALKTAGREAQRAERERWAAGAERDGVGAEEELDLQHHVASALRALPEPYRTTVYLRYYRELGPPAIAERQDVPVDTVKTRLRRGLELLRTDLDERFGGQRALWGAPLAAFLEAPWSPAASSAAGTAATVVLKGVGSMKLFATFAVATAVIAAVVVVSGPGSIPSEPTSPVAGAAPSEVQAPAPTRHPAQVAVAVAGDGRRVAEEAPLPAAAPALSTSALARVIGIDGRPVQGVQAVLRGIAGGEAVSSDDGIVAFVLPGSVESGEYELVLEHREFLPLRRPVDVRTGADADLGTFQIVRGGSIRGTVVDAAGATVRGAHVLAADPGQSLWQGVAEVASGGSERFTARTDERGRFVFTGVPAGPFRLWAGADGFVDASSSLLDVRSGEELRDVVIRLDPPIGGHEIAGRVALPEGLALAPGEDVGGLLKVWYSFETEEGWRARTALVGEDGRFRIQLEMPVPHDLWVQESPSGWDEQRHVYTGVKRLGAQRGVVVRDVAPGTLDLILTLEPSRDVAVEVTDDSGRVLDAFVLGIVEFSGHDLRQELPWFRDVTAPASFPIPSAGFYVSVYADGHDRVDLGPFDEETVPDVIRVELRPLPSVTGRVTAVGRPIAGAHVELLRPGSGRHRITSRGFLLRMHTVAVASGTTDRDGRYELTLRRSGDYFVRASATGWAAAELDEVRIDHTVGAEDLDLELVEGGAIEGRLLLPPGESAAGIVVGASRGDPYSLTVALEPDGRYRFSGLTPGDWLVQRVTNHEGPTSISSSREPVVWSGNCHVEDGATTEFDLDLSANERVVLQGLFELEGRALTGWQATLEEADGGEFDGEQVDSIAIGPDGSFELVAPAGGRYSLVLKPVDLGPDAVLAVRRLDLEGPVHAWSDRVRFGTVEGDLGDSNVASAPMIVWIVVEGDAITAARIVPDADGRFEARVPVGPGHLHYATPETMDEVPLNWPVAGGADVAVGATRTFRADGQ